MPALPGLVLAAAREAGEIKPDLDLIRERLKLVIETRRKDGLK